MPDRFPTGAAEYHSRRARYMIVASYRVFTKKELIRPTDNANFAGQRAAGESFGPMDCTSERGRRTSDWSIPSRCPETLHRHMPCRRRPRRMGGDRVPICMKARRLEIS